MYYGEKRSTKEVFDDHLRLAQEGKLEEDLQRNYAQDVVFLTRYGLIRGYKGARQLADLLDAQLAAGVFDYTNRLVSGEMAFLEWKGESPTTLIRDGADSFLIRDGRIRVQTIHYTVEPYAPLQSPQDGEEDWDFDDIEPEAGSDLPRYRR